MLKEFASYLSRRGCIYIGKHKPGHVWKFVFYINNVSIHIFKNELTRITIKISRRSVASNDVDQLSHYMTRTDRYLFRKDLYNKNKPAYYIDLPTIIFVHNTQPGDRTILLIIMFCEPILMLILSYFKYSHLLTTSKTDIMFSLVTKLNILASKRTASKCARTISPK